MAKNDTGNTGRGGQKSADWAGEDWLDGAIYFASRSDTEALTYIKDMPKSVLAILRAAVEEHAKPSGRSTEGSLVSGSK